MTRIADLKVYELKEQVLLQLGTKGSQTKINYGAKARLEYGPINVDRYLDIVNINRYNVTLGMVFMRKHGIVLDFDKNQVRQHNVVLPTLQESAEERLQVRRQTLWHHQKMIPKEGTLVKGNGITKWGNTH